MSSFQTKTGLVTVPVCETCRGSGFATQDMWVLDTSKCEACNGLGRVFSSIKSTISSKDLPLCVGCNIQLHYGFENNTINEGLSLTCVRGVFKYDGVFYLCCGNCLNERNERQKIANAAFWNDEILFKKSGEIYTF